MKTTIAAVLVGLEYAAVAVAATSPPRGVGPEFAKFYDDKKPFTCISNPKISIPFDRVNDDFCDCPDGSDEPGTAACAHLSPLSPRTHADFADEANLSAALPGFYCHNKGHRPSYVPFTNVNDGICDYELCCDGSEEWEGVGGVKCKNRCDEIGKEWRKQDEARRKSALNAAKQREALVAEALKLRKQLEKKIETTTAEIEAAEVKVKQLEQELAETKRSEEGKVVTSGKTGGRLGQLVELGKRRTEELRFALASQIAQNADRKARLEELEEIMATFKKEYNPNFNDEGVKRAVRAWEDYVASKPADSPAASQRDHDQIAKSDKENGLVWSDYEVEEEETSETDVLYAFEEYLPPSLRGWVDQKLRDFRRTLVENGILADDAGSGGSATESKRVIDARQRVEAAQRELEQHRTTRSETEANLSKDFGPDDVLRALQGQCIETDSGEYTYELCFLERTAQKPKKGGGATPMGSYARLERVTVDEDLPTDGRGLGSGERLAMKFENGQHCWNGPSRSTTVVLACHEKNEIWKIVEEEKCVYRMEVGTPAVCEPVAEAGAAAAAGAGRDEL